MSGYYGGGGGAPNLTTGLDAARPAASAGNVGKYYFGSDSLQLYKCSDATTWVVSTLNNGVDKVTFGPFSDANYISAGAGAAVGPTGQWPMTWAIGMYVESLPGATNRVFWNYLDAGAVNGWYIANSGVNANKFLIYLGNSVGGIELPSVTMTTGPHVLVISYIDATHISYCWDGGTVFTATPGGTYTAPGAGALHYVGRFANSTLAATFVSIAWCAAYNSALSNANMQALGATPSNYFPGNITPVPVFNMQARWYSTTALTANRIVPVGTQSVSMSMVGTVPVTSR